MLVFDRFLHTHTHVHTYTHREIHTQRPWLLNNSTYTNTHWRQGEGKSAAKLTGRLDGLQWQQPIRMERDGQGARSDPW